MEFDHTNPISLGHSRRNVVSTTRGTPRSFRFVYMLGGVSKTSLCDRERRSPMTRESPANLIRKEVWELMTITERIHSAMADGLKLTENEKRLLKMSDSELLASVSDN